MDAQLSREFVKDEEALNFMTKKEKELQAQYDSFINSNRIVIDLEYCSLVIGSSGLKLPPGKPFNMPLMEEMKQYTPGQNKTHFNIKRCNSGGL